MTRRFFSGIFASLTAASHRTIAFRAPNHQEVIPFESASSETRQKIWLRLRHTDGVRFTLGVLGQKPITSGMIAPSSQSQTGRDYGIQSVEGLKTSLPIMLTLSSRKPFSLLGLQEVFQRPYAVRSTGLYSFENKS